VNFHDRTNEADDPFADPSETGPIRRDGETPIGELVAAVLLDLVATVSNNATSEKRKEGA
jgi:hypothetical protein